MGNHDILRDQSTGLRNTMSILENSVSSLPDKRPGMFYGVEKTKGNYEVGGGGYNPESILGGGGGYNLDI